MFMTMVLALALALVDDRPFEADEQQYSAWLQQGCRLQQADRRDGHEPAEFEAFCAVSPTDSMKPHPMRRFASWR